MKRIYLDSLVCFLNRLKVERLNCWQLLNATGFKKSNLKYYKFCKSNNLITYDKDGQRRIYKLTKEGSLFLGLVEK